MSRRSRGAALLLALLAVLVAAGCSSLPTEGPIVETQADPAVEQPRPMGIDPSPPEPGASRAEVASGFLDAMRAWPQSFEVARSYLASESQSAWNPDQSTVTYADRGPLTEIGDTVALRLLDASRLDDKGAWQGELAPAAQVVRLTMVEEGGEYRIVDPPDVHYVPTDWFSERYRQANLYFLDPSSRILVPEPVFVPVGEQLASTLVQRLLAGPTTPEVTSTAFPAGLTVELSVPVSDDGVADIRLEGAPPPASQDVVDRMLAQLAWTLGAEGITAVRLTVSGTELRASSAPVGSDGLFDVTAAPTFDPAGYQSSGALFGLQAGRLVTGSYQGLAAVDGPFGARAVGVRDVRVDLSGSSAAAVSSDGTQLLTGSVFAAPESPLARPEVVVDDAEDLLPPAWDFDGRIWLVDRTGDGVEVSYVSRGRQRVVEVPGISGRPVTSFLVSRDGTRLVAVVREQGIDVVKVVRIVRQDDRSETQVLGAQTLTFDTDQQPRRVLDLAWTSTTTLAALSPVVAGERFEVRTLGVDGSPTDADSTIVTGPVVGLVSAPTEGTDVYADLRPGLFDLTDLTTSFFDQPVDSLTYVG